MRILINSKLWVFLLSATLIACYPEQDVAPIDSPEDNPVATIEPQEDYSSITEGDTLKYNITVSALLKSAVTFSVQFDESSTASAADIEVIGGVLPAYRGSTELWVVVLADDFPEDEEAISFEISAAEDIAYNFQLAPSSDVEEVSGTVANVNNPDGITVAMSWPDPEHVIDFDVFVEHLTLGTASIDGATGNNPEIDVNTLSYDGTYAYAIDPYDVPSGDVPFTIHVGYSDGTVETFDGVFNLDNMDSYPTTTISAYGFDAYTVLTVVKSGDDYDVNFEF